MRTVHAFRQAAADFQHEVKTALDDENIRRDQLQRQRKPPADEAESATDQENQQAPNPQQDSESLVRESDDRAAEFPVMVDDPRVALGVPRAAVLPMTVVINPQGEVQKVLSGPQTAHSILASR